MDGEANQIIRKKEQKAYYSILSMVPNKNWEVSHKMKMNKNQLL